jgi:tetratricopeptide (TPR) repeat protein
VAAHARYYLQRVRDSDGAIRGPQAKGLYDWFESEVDNIRGALRTLAGTDDGWELADLLGIYWFSTGRMKEGVRWLEAELARPGPRTRPRGRALCRLADLQSRLGAYSDCLATLDEAEAVAREVGDEVGVANVARVRAHPAAGVERYRLLASAAVAAAERSGEEKLVVFARLELGYALLLDGRVDEAEPHLLAVLEYAEQTGDVANLASPLGILASVAFRRGDVDASRRHLQRAIDTSLAVGARANAAEALVRLGLFEAAFENVERAAALASEALRLALEVDDDLSTLASVELLALLAADDRLFAAAQTRRAELHCPVEDIAAEVYERLRIGTAWTGAPMAWPEAIECARSLAGRALDSTV